MAQANVNTDLLNIVTRFVEQYGRQNAPTEKELEIFTHILRRFSGKVHVRNLPTLDLDRPLDWIREHSERFQVFEEDDGQAVMVGIVSRGVSICPDYNAGRRLLGCNKSDCQDFHVCRDFAGGWCRAGAGCRRRHTFTDDHNQRLVEWFHLDGFSCDELFRILAMSSPQVCNDYNNKGCGLLGRCTRVHVCRNYVAGKCTTADCDRAHDYNSAHSQRLLNMYRLNADNVRRHLLFYRVKPQQTRTPVRTRALHALYANIRGLGEDRDDPLDELLGLRRRQRRVLGATAQLLGDDNRPESPPPPPVVEEVCPVEESASTKPSSSANCDKLASTAAVAARSSMPRLSSKKEAKPSTFVTKKLQSLSLDRHRTKEQLESKKTAEIHIHPVASEKINICEKNIEDECPLRGKCPSHHYPQPFLWQVNAFDKWVTLEDVNDVIESSFCDPGKDDVLVKLPDIADGVFETELYGNIQFTEMTMYVSLLDMTLAVRRLTTESYVSTEVDSCYMTAVALATSTEGTRRSCRTKWVWYWKAPDGTWNRYKAQEQLEENFISGRGKCQLRVDGVAVTVDQMELVQENMRTGQKTDIRRRPEFCGTDHEKD